MKLRCIAPYRNDARDLIYQAGMEFETSDTMAAYLLGDAPGCFEPLTEPEQKQEAKHVPEPPENKAILTPRGTRARRTG